MSPPAKKFPCLKCDVHVKKTDKAVQCALCDLWVHVSCGAIDDELFKMISNITDRGIPHVWSCACCTNAVQKLNKSVYALEKRLGAVEDDVKDTKEDVKVVKDRVDVVENDIKDIKQANNAEKAAEIVTEDVFKEISDRENKKANLVLHQLQEAGVRVSEPNQRKEHDKSAILEVFNVMKCQVDFDSDVKFFYRAGELPDTATDTPRPVIIGFRNQAKRDEILSKGRNLKDTAFEKISVIPDLTRRQRQEEGKMREEANTKNQELTEEDRLNWEFKVVGPRGQRRVIKVKKREDSQSERPQSLRSKRRGTQEQNKQNKTICLESST